MDPIVRGSSEPIRLASEVDFDLGSLRVKPSRGEIEHSQGIVRIEPRQMQVLVALAQANGRTVSREELIARCWGGVVVGPDAVNRAISLLRRSVDDNATDVRIENLPRIGYRLVRLPPIAAEHDLRSSKASSAGTSPASLVAVLPFDGDGSQDAVRLADGVSDAILSALTRANVAVVARWSAFQFRGERKPQAPRALGASHVVDGTLLVDQDKVRVTAYIIDVSRNTTLWSERFAGSRNDLFEFENRIAAQLSHVLGVSFVPEQIALAEPVVRDLYARAVLGLEQPAREPIEQALAYLNEVVRRAPKFAAGWAALAEAQRLFMLYFPPDAQKDLCEESRRSAEAALALDPGIGAAYGTLASLIPRFGNWKKIEQLLDKGFAINPACPTLHYMSARFLISVGRSKEGLDRLIAVQRRNPLNAAIAVDVFATLLDVGLVDEALAEAWRAYTLWPGIMLVWSECVRLHVVTGNFEKTEAMLNSPPVVVAPDDVNLARRRLHLKARRLRQIEDTAAAVKNFQDFSQIGVAPACVAIHALTALDQPDAALAVANEIFVPNPPQAKRSGVNMMGTFTLAGEPDSTVLFRWEVANMRRLDGFWKIVDRIGLRDYWRQTNSSPDFLEAR